MKILKRDGTEVLFNIEKISAAIHRANAEVDSSHQLSESEISTICEDIQKDLDTFKFQLGVEDIQNVVENHLMSSRCKEVARKYITYRYTHNLIRNQSNLDDKILSLINLSNEEINQENSNKDPVINSVQRDYMAGEVSKDITLNKLLPTDIVEAHKNGLIHFHDADYFVQRMYNCFHSKTRFYTSTGIVSFQDLHDGDIVKVLCLDGQFREATVRNYGSQPMNIVTFKTSKRVKQVICTENHRWILKDGSITTHLKVGDTLKLLEDSTTLSEPSTYRQREMFCLGFLIGDGCDIGDWDGSQIRLCGKKVQYAHIFKSCGYRSHDIKDSQDITMSIKGRRKQQFLSSKSWKYLSESDKCWLFKGLMCADGDMKTRSRISSSDERIIELIRDTSYCAGYYISREVEVCEPTNYKEHDVYSLEISLIHNQYRGHRWYVSNIQPYHPNSKYNAWCVEEPVTHSFILEGGMITGNCCLINLDDMLQNGTVISETKIDKPKSFATACNIATQIIAQVASNQYGGQSINLSDLAPFVDISRQKIKQQLIDDMESIQIKLDEIEIKSIVERLLYREIKSGIQTIQYQVATLMTTNGQAPFITVFMYLDQVPEGQTREDLALLIEEMLNQRILGVKNQKGFYITPAFPKLIYVLDEDNIHKDSKYWYLTELAAKCTAKRMVPDYISAKVMKNLKGDIYSAMGCRSFLTPDRFTDSGIGNISRSKNYIEGKHKYSGRFNQGVVTINLVDVGLSANKDLDMFWNILDERLELCHRALKIRHERLEGTSSDVAPILWQHGAIARLDVHEPIDELLHHGYSTISLGYAGLWECVYSLIGKKLTEPEGEKLGLDIMKKLNEYTARWKEAEDIDYSLYGTPIESTTYKFAKCLQKRFGIIEGVTDKAYITNSYHVHVTEPIDAFSKLELESKFQELSPGGAISYVEVPNMQNNIPAVLEVMKFIYNNIMYAELNTKSDFCQVCNYDGEIEIVEDSDGKLIWKCPNCGNTDQSKMSVARRTCGYIGVQYWNQGRTQEIKERVLHL